MDVISMMIQQAKVAGNNWVGLDATLEDIDEWLGEEVLGREAEIDTDYFVSGIILDEDGNAVQEVTFHDDLGIDIALVIVAEL